MRKYIGMGEELLNRYRLDFCYFTEANFNLFETLFIEQLSCFNDRYNGLYQNYIGSSIYKKKKAVIYEMLFSSYLRTRIKGDLSLTALKNKSITNVDFARLALSTSIDKVCHLTDSKFRKERDQAFMYQVYHTLDGSKAKFTEKEVAELLSRLAPDKNCQTIEKFNRLSHERKQDYFHSAKCKAFLALEKSAFKHIEESEA